MHSCILYIGRSKHCAVRLTWEMLSQFVGVGWTESATATVDADWTVCRAASPEWRVGGSRSTAESRRALTPRTWSSPTVTTGRSLRRSVWKRLTQCRCKHNTTAFRSQLNAYTSTSLTAKSRSDQITVFTASTKKYVWIKYQPKNNRLLTPNITYFFLFFWQAPLDVCSAKRRHQSPEWTIPSHFNCSIQGQVIRFQVVLDRFQPHSMRASWWSPVLKGSLLEYM